MKQYWQMPAAVESVGTQDSQSENQLPDWEHSQRDVALSDPGWATPAKMQKKF